MRSSWKLLGTVLLGVLAATPTHAAFPGVNGDLFFVSARDGIFADEPDILSRLEPLQAVGLEYMKLGQPVPTLSGGEAQRLKLAGRLAKARSGPNGDTGALLLFDEPTTGLHFDDIAKLLSAFRQLIEQGHSLVVIEHNLDVVRAADWIIDDPAVYSLRR